MGLVLGDGDGDLGCGHAGVACACASHPFLEIGGREFSRQGVVSACINRFSKWVGGEYYVNHIVFGGAGCGHNIFVDNMPLGLGGFGCGEQQIAAVGLHPVGFAGLRTVGEQAVGLPGVVGEIYGYVSADWRCER